MSKLTVFRILVSVILAALLSFGSLETTTAQPNVSIGTFDDLMRALDTIRQSEDPAERDALVNQLWETLVANGRVPFIDGEQVAFLYRGEARVVYWMGDFNQWDRDSLTSRGEQVGESDLWLLTKTFPLDARFGYLIAIDSGPRFLDPANPIQGQAPWGPYSELAMPNYRQPVETILDPGVTRGVLTDDIVIASENLSYNVAYRVYTPPGYEDLEDLPAVYVLDGSWFYDDTMIGMRITLDNLIAQGRIQPIIAVFVDARDPEHPDNNRRDSQYIGNVRFAGFLAQELVPAIDASYRTAPDPDARAVMGFSSGADGAIFIGLQHPEVFHKVGSFSSDIWTVRGVSRLTGDSERLPLDFFIFSGNPEWDSGDPSSFLEVLDKRGYPYQYAELPGQGHSHIAVRDALPGMFIYFFPMGAT